MSLTLFSLKMLIGKTKMMVQVFRLLTKKGFKCLHLSNYILQLAVSASQM